MSTVDVLFAHQPTKFVLPQPSRRRAVQMALRNEPLFCGYTELGDNDDMMTAKQAVMDKGYRPIMDKAWEPGIAVREDVEIITSGATLVHGGSGNVPGKGGGYRPRHIVWARGMLNGDEDLDFWFGEFHSITFHDGSRQDLRRLMAKTVAQEMNHYGLGRTIAIGVGDGNEADVEGHRAPQAEILKQAGITTIWDELGTWPDTFDSRSVRAIDWFLTRDADLRFSWVDATVTDAPDSDHHLIEAVGRVKKRDPKPVPVSHACPLCVPPDVHEGVLLNG